MYGEGRYVMKALDLKLLHAPLTPEQQAKYDMWHSGAADVQNITYADQALSQVSDITSSVDSSDLMSSPTARIDAGDSEDDIHVKPLDVENPYNTINLQQALAANMQEVLGGSSDTQDDPDDLTFSNDADMADDGYAGDDGQDSAAVADIPETSDDSYTDDSDDASDTDGYLGQTRVYKPVNMQLEDDSDSSSTVSFAEAHKVIKQMENETAAMKAINEEQAELVPGARTGVLTPLNTLSSGFDDVLQQDSDGQISLVMPDREAIEKQITGQLSIDDVMAEWEHMKQENEKKRMNEVRQRILQNTGNLFDDFDEDTRNDLLEKLEKAFVAAVIKESKEKGSAPDTALLSDEEITRETEKAVRQATEPLPEISDEELEKAGHKDNAEEDAEEDGRDADSDEGVEEIAEIEEDGEAAAEEEIRNYSRYRRYRRYRGYRRSR
jgi:hypothetical protein